MSNPFGSNSKGGSDFVFRYTAGKKGEGKEATYSPHFLQMEKSEAGTWEPCKDQNGRHISFTSLKGYVYGCSYRIPDDPAHTDSFLVFMSTEPNGAGLRSSVRFSLGSTGWNVLNALANVANWGDELIEFSVYTNRKNGYASIAIRDSKGEYAPVLLEWDDFRALQDNNELPEVKIRANARSLYLENIAPLHEIHSKSEATSPATVETDDWSMNAAGISDEPKASADDDDLPF